MSFLSRRIAQANRKYKYLRDDIRQRVGLNNELFTNKAGGCRILTYHGICLQSPTRFNASFITQKTFEKHLQFYKKHFHVVSLDEYYAGKFVKDRFNVCITFDDGHRNNLEYALPLLERYGLPATFFITGIRKAGYDILWNDFLAIFSKYGPKKLVYKQEDFHKNFWNKYISTKNGQYLQDRIRNGGFDLKTQMMNSLATLVDFRSNKKEEDFWLQMTADEINQLSKSKIASIGAHGFFHNDLTKIDPEAAKEELIACKSFLEHVTQKEVAALAFPYGSYNPSLKTEAKNAGFKRLLALDFLLGDDDRKDSTILERFVVNPYISVNNQMLAIVRGKYYHNAR